MPRKERSGKELLISYKKWHQRRTKNNTGSKKTNHIDSFLFPSFVAFKSFTIDQQLTFDLQVPYDKSKAHSAALVKEKYGLSNWELFRACYSREVLIMKRHSFVYVFKTVQITIMSVIAMTVFFRTEMKVGTVIGGSKFLGALFFSLINVMFNGIAELALTISLFPVFFRQRDFLFYPAWAFSLPMFILRIPLFHRISNMDSSNLLHDRVCSCS